MGPPAFFTTVDGCSSARHHVSLFFCLFWELLHRLAFHIQPFPLPFSNYSCWCWTSSGLECVCWTVLEGAVKQCVAATDECINLCALFNVPSALTASWGWTHCQHAEVKHHRVSALSGRCLESVLCLSADVLSSKCQLARSQALRASARSDSLSVFIPICKADGTYAEVLWC